MAVTESARPSGAVSRKRRATLLVVGLAAAARLAQNGQANSLARLVAWDRRQQVRILRTVKGKAQRT